MTRAEQKVIELAYLNGSIIQRYSEITRTWDSVVHLVFNWHLYKYRIKSD